MAVIFNSVSQYIEQINRRATYRFGDAIEYVFVYTGPTSTYSNWNPQLGSVHPVYPLLFLNNINKTDKEAGISEVVLSYLGSDQKGLQYVNLKITSDLLSKSFNWQGAAYNGTSGPLVNFNFEVQYTTIEVTYSYTTFSYLNKTLFDSQAPNYVKTIQSTYQITTSQVTPGRYTGVPTIKYPIKSVLMCDRWQNEQMTPNLQGTNGIWRVSETWCMDYNMGSFGFQTYNP
jgi:hypothetical protein